jgi:hypothetical protein
MAAEVLAGAIPAGKLVLAAESSAAVARLRNWPIPSAAAQRA